MFRGNQTFKIVSMSQITYSSLCMSYTKALQYILTWYAS